MKNKKIEHATPFARRLKIVRQCLKLSQGKFGELIGLKEEHAGITICQYERGVHEPSYKTVSRVCDATGIPQFFFYCDEDHLAWHIINQTLNASKTASNVLELLSSELRFLLVNKPDENETKESDEVFEEEKPYNPYDEHGVSQSDFTWYGDDPGTIIK